MKRDMDLVRHILIATEKAEEPLDIEEISKDGVRYSLPLVAYHVEMLDAHGLLDASLTKSWGDEVVGGTIKALTWDGCDYLDAIRDAGVWAKTKEVVKEAVGSTTMEVIKQAAVMVATSVIKAHLGIT